ncbi:MAG: exopolyphosphatase [Pedobacter sp.]|nr:MAG: exopolyphosphatase [Pedobacter sp.]
MAAVMDLGTNTFHLIIAEISGKEIEILYKTNLPVKLGEGKINENIIIPAAFRRGIEALRTFKDQIISHDAKIVRAIATSAIRSASNGNEFVKAADTDAGISIEVIDGDQEAEYIYKGVLATGLIEQTSLIMDIGGGSTEFIVCNQERQLWKKSYNIGAARLQQAYFNSDPISANDQLAIKNRLDEELKDLKIACEKYQPLNLIGSAGAFETFAGMIYENLNIKEFKSANIDINAYQELSLRFIKSTHQERVTFKGLIPLRVDMIVIASLITNYVLGIADFQKMSVSTYDLKMGVLSSIQA